MQVQCRFALDHPLTSDSATRRFARALVFGSLAALLGSGLYFAVLSLTGYEFGLVAIVVGLMVGNGVRYGARGRGGWSYQLLAVALTYNAIVVTYVPSIVQAIVSESPTEEGLPAPPAPAQPRGGETDRIAADNEAAPAGIENAAVASSEGSPGAAAVVLGLAALFAIAFVSPFLLGFENVIGLVIIGIGLYEAWKLNRRVPLVVTGPHAIGGGASAT